MRINMCVDVSMRMHELLVCPFLNVTVLRVRKQSSIGKDNIGASQ